MDEIEQIEENQNLIDIPSNIYLGHNQFNSIDTSNLNQILTKLNYIKHTSICSQIMIAIKNNADVDEKILLYELYNTGYKYRNNITNITFLGVFNVNDNKLTLMNRKLWLYDERRNLHALRLPAGVIVST